MYKTENFKKLKNWMPRVFIISIAFGIILFVIIQSNLANLPIITLLSIGYVLLIVANQIAEIEIQQDLLIYEQKSILPQLNYKIEIPFGLIKTVDLISDQTMTEKGWLMFQKNQKPIVQITMKEGLDFRMNGKVHPKGSKNLKKIIEENIKAADNSVLSANPNPTSGLR
jgi:energy-converting hydrogenase Eha subunit C